MKAGYKITSTPCYSYKNELAVYNYHNLNLISTTPVIDRTPFPTDCLVGFWKIKQLKQL